MVISRRADHAPPSPVVQYPTYIYTAHAAGARAALTHPGVRAPFVRANGGFARKISILSAVLAFVWIFVEFRTTSGPGSPSASIGKYLFVPLKKWFLSVFFFFFFVEVIFRAWLLTVRKIHITFDYCRSQKLDGSSTMTRSIRANLLFTARTCRRAREQASCWIKFG